MYLKTSSIPSSMNNPHTGLEWMGQFYHSSCDTAPSFSQELTFSWALSPDSEEGLGDIL